jgi:hypothetical protein
MSCGSGASNATGSSRRRMRHLEAAYTRAGTGAPGAVRPAGSPSCWRDPRTVDPVADQRMADRRHVHPDLVRAPGLRPAAHVGKPTEALEHFVERRTTRGRRSSTTVMRSGCLGSVAIGRSIQSLWKRGSPCTMQRYSFSAVRSLELRAQELHRLLRLGDQHHTRGVAVEPVHDARAVLVRRGRQLAEAGPRPAGDRVRHHRLVLDRVRREPTPACRSRTGAGRRTAPEPPAAAGQAPAGRGPPATSTSNSTTWPSSR